MIEAEQGIHLFHDRPQRMELGQPTSATPQELAFGFGQVTLDEQMPLGEQRGALRCQPLFRAGCRLRGLRAWPTSGQCGLRGCQALAGAGHGTSDRLVHLGHNMKRTDLMRDIPEHLHEGCGIEGRAISREAAEGQVADR